MQSLIDPRPLEPAWVHEIIQDDLNQLEWQIVQHKKNPTAKRIVKSVQSGSDMVDLFRSLENIVRSGEEAEVSVDSTMLADLDHIPSLGDWISINTNIPSSNNLKYEAVLNYEDVKPVADNEEFLFLVELAIYHRQQIDVTIRSAT